LKKIILILNLLLSNLLFADSNYYIGLGTGVGNFNIIATDDTSQHVSQENDTALSLHTGVINSHHKFEFAYYVYDTLDRKYMEDITLEYDYLFTNNSFQPFLGVSAGLNSYEEDRYIDSRGNEWNGVELYTLFANLNIGFQYEISKKVFLSCAYVINIIDSSEDTDTIYRDNENDRDNIVNLKMDTIDKIILNLNYKF
jgi:hypothetical protein